MNLTAERFFRELNGKKVAFMGIGVSHTDTIRQFAKKGIATIACDKRTEASFDDALLKELRGLGVELRLGEGYFDNLDMDVLFRTPGMYFHLPRLREYRDRGGVVTSEMEVFFDLCPCPAIGVTGSDGKTTTTTLIAEMLRESGKTAHLGGNIGRALLPLVENISPEDFAVVELSSFQLISMRRSPDIAVVTNVEPNHLDVHGTMEEYIEAKRNLYLHQNAFGKAVLNADNEITRSFAPELRGRSRFFSLRERVAGAWLRQDGMLCLTDAAGNTSELFSKEEIRLPGMHNVANYLAAITAAEGLVPVEAMRRVAAGFGGVAHRIEFVREHRGVKWYNDSIATSPTRSIAGLRSFAGKLVMIAGGYDKKIPFAPLAPEICAHVKLLILTGATAPGIEAAVHACPDYREDMPRILRADNLAGAVRLARENTLPGDIVTLSPASASFDAYPNFEARGQHFKELVAAL